VTRGVLSASVRRVTWLIGAYLPSRLVRRRRDFNCAFQDSATWDERASESEAMLRTYLSAHQEPAATLVIGDFGAGTERLRGVLERALQCAHEYHAFDLVPQQPTTTRIDLATETPAGPFDVVFCLGVLDYFQKPADLLSRIGSVSQLVVFSYVVVDGAERLSRRERRARGWLSDLSAGELDRELERIGLRSRAVRLTNRDRTRLWLVESAVDRPIDAAREPGPS
jgi:hypothetical protein